MDDKPTKTITLSAPEMERLWDIISSHYDEGNGGSQSEELKLIIARIRVQLADQNQNSK